MTHEFRAAVSGGSATGLTAALILAKSGYRVDLFEKRHSYRRKLQWVARQSLLDSLASIDQELANRTLEELVSEVGMARWIAEPSQANPDGEISDYDMPTPQRGNPDARYESSVAMLQESGSSILVAHQFESLLKHFVDKDSRITVHNRLFPDLDYDSHSRSYSINGVRASQDLIVIAEGAKSVTRKRVGIRSLAASRPVAQMSGCVMLPSDLAMAKYLQCHGEEFILSGLLAGRRAGYTWIVADVSADTVRQMSRSNNELEKHHILLHEFVQTAAKSMQASVESVRGASLCGITGRRGPNLLRYQSRISDRAAAGTNLILMGDAVGSGHWASGGGMQLALVSHKGRLTRLLSSIDSGESRRAAVEEYEEGVMRDTASWIIVGNADFYPGYDRKRVTKVVAGAMKEHAQDRSRPPAEMVEERLLREGRAES